MVDQDRCWCGVGGASERPYTDTAYNHSRYKKCIGCGRKCCDLCRDVIWAEEKEPTGSGILFYPFRCLLYVTRMSKHPKTQEGSSSRVGWQSLEVLQRITVARQWRPSLLWVHIFWHKNLVQLLRGGLLMMPCGESCGHTYYRSIRWGVQREISSLPACWNNRDICLNVPIIFLCLMNLMASPLQHWHLLSCSGIRNGPKSLYSMQSNAACANS